MLFDINRYKFSTFIKHTHALLLLAVPTLLAQLAQVGTGFVDTVMAGGASKDDLAAVALGNSLFVTIYVSLMGVMTAINPILSQAFGALGAQTDKRHIGEIGRQGLYLGVLLGVLGMLTMWTLIDFFQSSFNLSAYGLKTAGEYIYYIGYAMPAAIIHRALHAYALSLERPNIITAASFVCFFLNIPLNYAFVYGAWGMPKLGGAGCGLATAIVFWVNVAILWGYVAKNDYFKQFGMFSGFSLPDVRQLKAFLTLGVPIGLSFFIEVSLFTCIMFLVAKLTGDTTTMVAAQQIVISITSLIFMIPQSIGVASTARVGYFLGRRAHATARYVSGAALLLAVIMSVVTALFLVVARYPLAQMYTDDVAVIHLAASVILFASAFQLVDAVQCVASYALRGYQVTKLPMLVHIVAFWGCGLLPGYYLAFHQQMAIFGFWWALVMSLGVASVLLLGLLEYHSKKVAHQARVRVI